MVAIIVNFFLHAREIWVDRKPRPFAGFGITHWSFYALCFCLGMALSGAALDQYLNGSPDRLTCMCRTYDNQLIECEDKWVIPEHPFNCTVPIVTLYRDCKQYAREGSGLENGITVYFQPTQLSECPKEQGEVLSMVIGCFCLGSLLFIELVIYYLAIVIMAIGWGYQDVSEWLWERRSSATYIVKNLQLEVIKYQQP